MSEDYSEDEFDGQGCPDESPYMVIVTRSSAQNPSSLRLVKRSQDNESEDDIEEIYNEFINSKKQKETINFNGKPLLHQSRVQMMEI